MTLQYLYTYPFLDPHYFSSEMEDYPREQSGSFCFSKAVWSNFTNTAPGDQDEDEQSFDVRQFSELCHWLRKAADYNSSLTVREGVSVFLKALLWEIWGRVSEPLPIDPNGFRKASIPQVGKLPKSRFCSDVAQETGLQIKFYFWKPSEAF